MPLEEGTGDVTITWADVIAFATELTPLSTIEGQWVMNTVQDEVTLAVWGAQERVDRAALMLACHLGNLKRMGMWGGPLNAVDTGQVRKQFKQRQDKAWMFDQTKYGMEYQRLVTLWLPIVALGA